MPLLDHFHPPLSNELRWESFHSNWATKLADALNNHWLPDEYIAEETAHVGPSVEIDVATFARSGTGADGSVTSTLPALAAPAMVLPSAIPETFEVRIISTVAGPKLVAAIELVSPGNKDRPAERRAFATKCASYLFQGIGLILVDVVTNRRANLHNEIMGVMEVGAGFHLPADTGLYGMSYRPLRRDGKDEIEVRSAPVAVGQPLPTLPLPLNVELVIPIDFEATYADACRSKRLI